MFNGTPEENRDQLHCMFKQREAILIQETNTNDFDLAMHHRKITNYRSKGSRIEIQLEFYDADHGFGPDVWFRVGRQDNVLVSDKPNIVLEYSL